MPDVSSYLDVEWARGIVKKNNSEGKEGGNSYRWASFPDDGKMEFRILPVGYGPKKIGFLLHKHYNLPEMDAMTCFETYGLDCNVCDVLKEKSNLIDVSPWTRVARSYFNVLIKNSSKYDPNLPYILGGPEYNLRWLLEMIMDNKKNICDSHIGHNLIFKRKKHKGPFERTVVLDPSPLADSEEKIKKIIEACSDLTKIWRSPDEKFINEMKEGAVVIEKWITNRISKMSEESSKVEESSDPPESESAGSQKEDAEKSVKKIEGSPDCFGKSFVENAADTDSESTKKQAEDCVFCSFDFQCKTAMDGTG